MSLTVKYYVKFYDIEVPNSLKHLGNADPGLRKLYLEGTKLTPRQTAILAGTLLGDARVDRNLGGSSSNAYISFAQHNRLNYLNWLHDELAPFSKSLRKYSGPKNEYHYFRTVRYEPFNILHDMFYKGGGKKKYIPSDIGDYLTDLSLAVLFADDGYNAGFSSTIATYSFSFEDCEMLAKVFKDKFNIAAKVHSFRHAKTDRRYPELLFRAVAHKQLHYIIDDLLNEDFAYKRLK